MTKYVRITMPDLSQWDIPIERIAMHKWQYEMHRPPDDRLTYDEIIADPEDLAFDWGPNNMDWKDVELVARRVTPATTVDYQAGWLNGGRAIVDVD